MNIFVLDRDIENAVQFQVKMHCTKMPLETAQLLSTCHRIFESRYAEKAYRKTHENHPCSIWVRESRSNYDWLYDFWCKQFEEFRYRRNKSHSSEKLLDVLKYNPVKLDRGLTPFALCMPDKYKVECPIESYRIFYNNEKRHLFDWEGKRPVPDWVYDYTEKLDTQI